MLNSKLLLNNGYTEHPLTANDSSGTLFQKRVRNEQGETLYFINIEYWNFSAMVPENINSWYARARMYVDDHVWVEYTINDEFPLDVIEGNLGVFWDANNFIPDPYNQ